MLNNQSRVCCYSIRVRGESFVPTRRVEIPTTLKFVSYRTVLSCVKFGLVQISSFTVPRHEGSTVQARLHKHNGQMSYCSLQSAAYPTPY